MAQNATPEQEAALNAIGARVRQAQLAAANAHNARKGS